MEVFKAFGGTLTEGTIGLRISTVISYSTRKWHPALKKQHRAETVHTVESD